jgi:1,4-dihydroxy-6-naphthoate synthase
MEHGASKRRSDERLGDGTGRGSGERSAAGESGVQHGAHGDAIELTLGHSPDADDAFMWWPLGTAGLEGGPRDAPELPPAIDTGRYRFRPVAADIEALNARAVDRGDLDISAMSFAALARVADRYVATACGASFGEGYGPKVVRRAGGEAGGGSGDGEGGVEGGVEAVRRIVEAGGAIAVPGELTTAYLTLRLMLAPLTPRAVVMRFDEIVPAVLAGVVDAGLVIHEAQVTYEGEGLELLADLGAWWAQETASAAEPAGLPMPLGANAVRRDLDDRFGAGTAAEVAQLLAQSVRHAMAHRDQGLDYAMRFADPAAREAGDAVDRFVGLYVNELTVEMGERGRRAVSELLSRGAAAGLAPTARVAVVG